MTHVGRLTGIGSVGLPGWMIAGAFGEAIPVPLVSKGLLSGDMYPSRGESLRIPEFGPVERPVAALTHFLMATLIIEPHDSFQDSSSNVRTHCRVSKGLMLGSQNCKKPQKTWF